MAAGTGAGQPLSDKDLLLAFESLGDNCELGLIQRRVGVEPLGLFRFASAPARHLIRALEARFEGIADPAAIQVEPVNDEYFIVLTKYSFNYHADVKIGAADPAVVQTKHVRTVGFLVDKLISDLQAADKILVFRQNETLSANDLIDLRRALAAYGTGVLLWVQAAKPGHAPGDIEVVDDTLMIGYVTRLARREYVPDLDLQSWLIMLRNAYALRPRRAERAQEPLAPATPPARRGPVEVVFGQEGNASGYAFAGWSAPENGYTWSINDRSVLRIPSPGIAKTYRLDMNVIPYVVPPVLPAQSLQIEVNGELAHSFDPLPRGQVTCTIPGRLIGERAMVEILLHHPQAAAPRAVAGQKDGRRLAISFLRLCLSCA